MSYKLVCGIETHIELATKLKSSVPAQHNSAANLILTVALFAQVSRAHCLY